MRNEDLTLKCMDTVIFAPDLIEYAFVGVFQRKIMGDY